MFRNRHIHCCIREQEFDISDMILSYELNIPLHTLWKTFFFFFFFNALEQDYLIICPVDLCNEGLTS